MITTAKMLSFLMNSEKVEVPEATANAFSTSLF
jgi:hypothetical protein